MRIIVALIALALPFAVQASEPAQAIDRFINAALPASGAPGVAYAIVDNGEIRAGAHGTTLVGGDRPVTPDIPFLIGSISKSFTALAVMQLVENSKVDLDAPIATYLHAFSGRASGAITVRQLLSHTSGYSTVRGNTAVKIRSSSKHELLDYVDEVAGWNPAYPAGSRWEYSNANYRILGALIEAVSGEHYAHYVTSHILRPIGMTHSFVSDGRAPGDFATGHRPWFGGKGAYRMRRTDRASAPAGGIFASANDLGRYLAMMLNGRNDVVSAASKAQMLRPASDASPFYGLGWFVDPGAGRASHGGLVPGTEGLVTIVPEARKGAVVLVNANGGIGFGDTRDLLDGITARALDLERPDAEMHIGAKFTYLMVMLMPIIFLASMIWAWRERAKLRAKSGAFGLFSLWFPLLAMVAMAGTLMIVVPRLFGGSIDTLLLYQPDFARALVVAAITGPLWAVLRLGLAYRPAAAAKS